MRPTADLIARLDMGKILNTLTGDAETGIDKLKAVILDGEGLKVENTRRKKPFENKTLCHLHKC